MKRIARLAFTAFIAALLFAQAAPAQKASKGEQVPNPFHKP